MTTQSNTLSTTARSAIVSTFVHALTTAENTGNLVTQVCETANKYLKGAEISDADMSSIGHDIAKARNWKGPAARSRLSEVRVVLRASSTLPEAIKAYASKASKCDWHTSMKLARCLNRGESVKTAVSSAFVSNTTKQTSKSTPQGRTAGALKSWFKLAKGDKKTAILKAAEILGLKLGVKLDA
jgi:hypothetical protein